MKKKKSKKPSNLPIPQRRLPKADIEWLAERLKSFIIDGRYRVGDRLPPVDYFVRSEQFKAGDIEEALRRLESAGLIHSSANLWIAGSRSRFDLSGMEVRNKPPVIVLLVNEGSDWYNFFCQTHTTPFAMHFISEAARYGIQIILAFRRGKADLPHVPLPQGEAETGACIRELGDRYLGTLMFAEPGDQEDMISWIRMLDAFGKPVVYFDHAVLGWYFNRTNVGASERYYRFYFNDPAADRLVLETLSSLGHRVIGIPIYSRNRNDWPLRRLQALQALAPTLDPPLTIVTSVHSEPFWNFEIAGGWETMHYSIDKVIRQAMQFNEQAQLKGKKVAAIRDQLVANTPSLSSFFKSGSVTALVPMSERFAREYFFWLKAVDVQVPEQLSMLTYDFTPETLPFPISTVDFGFSQLAYRAVHVFVGDIPAEADTEGNVPCHPRLINKGSLAPPPAIGVRL